MHLKQQLIMQVRLKELDTHNYTYIKLHLV